MPNRIISEKCRSSPTLAALSDAAERLWWRITTYVDDYGRFEAVPKLISGTCVPLLQWKDRKVIACLIEYAIERPPDQKPLVIYYAVRGRLYGQLTTFLDHQRKRTSKPKYPPVKDGTRIIPAQLAATCGDSRQVAALSESRETRDESESRDLSPQAANGKLGEECPEEIREKLFRKQGHSMTKLKVG